jgi:hypothetical protein
MLQRSPHKFSYNIASYVEGYHTKQSKSKDDDSNNFNNGRVSLFASTILPIPKVEWLSISGNFVGAFDFFDPSDGTGEVIEVTEKNGNLNYYANLGVVLDFSFLTIGMFPGSYSDIMKESQTVSSINDVKKEFKFTFIPIIKTAQWLSFLKVIANYINFGSLNSPDFGQHFVSTPINIAGNNLNITAYYNNESYSSFARNWLYGAEVKYGWKFYTLLNVGYRDFYDFPLESDLKDSFVGKIILGYENINGIYISALHNFQGWGVGMGVQFRVFTINTECDFNDNGMSAFKLSLQLCSN